MARGLLAVVIAALLAAGCVSPEAARTRGGGPGADVGNRGPTVDLHGQPEPFFRTPPSGQGVKVALQPARAGAPGAQK